MCADGAPCADGALCVRMRACVLISGSKVMRCRLMGGGVRWCSKQLSVLREMLVKEAEEQADAAAEVESSAVDSMREREQLNTLQRVVMNKMMGDMKVEMEEYKVASQCSLNHVCFT